MKILPVAASISAILLLLGCASSGGDPAAQYKISGETRSITPRLDSGQNQATTVVLPRSGERTSLKSIDGELNTVSAETIQVSASQKTAGYIISRGKVASKTRVRLKEMEKGPPAAWRNGEGVFWMEPALEGSEILSLRGQEIALLSEDEWRLLLREIRNDREPSPITLRTRAGRIVETHAFHYVPRSHERGGAP